MVNGEKPNKPAFTSYSGAYPEFAGTRYRVVNKFTPDRGGRQVIMLPTYMAQIRGDIEVSAQAPTIIEGITGKVTVYAMAPVLMKNIHGEIDLQAEESTVIESLDPEKRVGHIRIAAARNLEFVAKEVHTFNGEYTAWRPVRINPPQGNFGHIYINGKVDSVDFSYLPGRGLSIPEERQPTLVDRVKQHIHLFLL
jgi:hypothetical protein